MQSHVLIDNAISIAAKKAHDRVGPVLEKCVASYQSTQGHYYDSPYGFINLAQDREYAQEVFEIVAAKKTEQYAAIFVIGIGGSSLGAQSIDSALNKGETVPLYFVDTIDSRVAKNVQNLIKKPKKNNKRVLCVVISKSGTTLETCVNASLIVPLVDPEDVIVITNKSSALYSQAQAAGYTICSIPELVGGRFSVFSAVGMIPLGIAGYDIRSLLAGAQNATEQFIEKKDIEDDVISISSSVYALKEHGYFVYDTFVFDQRLALLGQWFRQLVGESLCKRHDILGNVVETGIIPTVSIGTQDLHSVVQLYLGGPRTVMTQFLSVSEESDILVGDTLFSQACGISKTKSLGAIKSALFDGVCKAYAKEKRPYVSYSFDVLEPYALGRWMQQKMLETIVLAELMQINPFDQPQVELYKKEARKLLYL